PAILPAAGATGTLEFAWIDPPKTFPYTLVYVARPPADASGQRFFHGAVEYRLLGGPQYSPPVVTAVNGPTEPPPTLTLLGDNPVEIAAGTDWIEPGYTATDSRGQDLTNRVTVSGAVDTATPGTYTLEYRLDWNGQNPVRATRTVIVTEASDNTDNTPPSPAPRPTGAPPLPPPAEQRIDSAQSSSATAGQPETPPSAATGSESPSAAPASPTIPGMPSLDNLRPLAGKEGQPVRQMAIGLTPEQRAALPPEAMRPFPPPPDVNPDQARAEILKALEEEEKKNALADVRTGTESASATDKNATPKPSSFDRFTLLIALFTGGLLIGCGAFAGKLVYGHSAWKRPGKPGAD
ncbi:MAG TPA: DUF5011 domain-containing protein, partial [Candidatus Hydrogenedentes bacterium]|nr:DUF5011 domain-containing protein [Candidatus Hydrogenedentota bacterium]